MNRRRKEKKEAQWRRVDLHLHTPASADYQEPGVSYLDILQEAERKGLDIIAFTDHNTVAGYRGMVEEINQLELLEQLNRLAKQEEERLKEYRRLRERVLVLPGLEFTATFGFHILGIFGPEVDVRELEFLLRRMNIPPGELDKGSAEIGASTDVLTAYRAIADAGGIVIAAHANSSNGVAMRGFDFGGQTRIAYTQDRSLHALEVTDLDKKGRRTTTRFFDGSKPEYPRRMRCIQGSDSHRLTRGKDDPRRLGLGDRITEVLLPEVSFEALREVFLGDDFALTRPYYPTAQAPFDHVQSAREEGQSIVQHFHERYSRQGGHLYAILGDVCAFANTNGGTLYIGLSDDAREMPVGVSNPNQAIKALMDEIPQRITPPLNVATDVLVSQGKKIVRVAVPRGADPPYAIDDNKIYVRSESETGLAVRDEIVNLVSRAHMPVPAMGEVQSGRPEPPRPGVEIVASEERQGEVQDGRTEPPRTGVEIVASEERQGVLYHSMRDLRNGNVVKNVTRKSARKLWRYAITQAEDHPVESSHMRWEGSVAQIRKREWGGQARYDLAQREDGQVRVYYGVTDDGIHGAWAGLVGVDTEE